MPCTCGFDSSEWPCRSNRKGRLKLSAAACEGFGFIAALVEARVEILVTLVCLSLAHGAVEHLSTCSSFTWMFPIGAVTSCYHLRTALVITGLWWHQQYQQRLGLVGKTLILGSEHWVLVAGMGEERVRDGTEARARDPKSST